VFIIVHYKYEIKPFRIFWAFSKFLSTSFWINILKIFFKVVSPTQDLLRLVNDIAKNDSSFAIDQSLDPISTFTTDDSFTPSRIGNLQMLFPSTSLIVKQLFECK
jgi:hypothetical protein